MSKKDAYLTQQRNTAIRRAYQQYIRQGMSCMRAYSRLANEYYMSIDWIRTIVAQRATG